MSGNTQSLSPCVCWCLHPKHHKMSYSQWEFQLLGDIHGGTSFLLSFLTTHPLILDSESCRVMHVLMMEEKRFLLMCDYSHLKSVTVEPDVRTRKIVKVVTQTMVNGKVVDESSEVERFEERKKWAKVEGAVMPIWPEHPADAGFVFPLRWFNAKVINAIWFENQMEYKLFLNFHFKSNVIPFWPLYFRKCVDDSGVTNY